MRWALVGAAVAAGAFGFMLWRRVSAKSKLDAKKDADMRAWLAAHKAAAQQQAAPETIGSSSFAPAGSQPVAPQKRVKAHPPSEKGANRLPPTPASSVVPVGAKSLPKQQIRRTS